MHLFSEKHSHPQFGTNYTFTGILYLVGEPRIPLKIAAAGCLMTAVAESLFAGRSLGQCNKKLNTSVAAGDNSKQL